VRAQAKNECDVLVARAAPVEFIQHLRQNQRRRTRARHVAGDDGHPLPRAYEVRQRWAAEGLGQRVMDQRDLVTFGAGPSGAETVNVCRVVQF
jgi:xanthine/CO dehydrogenase XdhC/CoxF family maturation factor